MFMLVCTILLLVLLIGGSACLYWSWLHNKEKASQHAEHLRELRDMQKLPAEIIQFAEEAREETEHTRNPSTEHQAQRHEFSGAYFKSHVGVCTWQKVQQVSLTLCPR